MAKPSPEGFKGMSMGFTLLLVVVVLLLPSDVAAGGKPDPKNLHSSVVKSIQSEDGDVIDCVNIYKQPAFNHPLLQNHIIQMEPSFDLKKFANNSMTNASLVQQLWQRSGSCPQGTIPIHRSSEQGLNLTDTRIERTELLTHGATYHGANARFNIWNVKVEPKEFSLNYVKIFNGMETNHVEAGWGVYPALFGDDRTRVYCYWTAAEAVESGCYNLQCPGFVQVSKQIALGTTIWPVSTYNGDQRCLDLHIIKDNANKNWWLFIYDEPAGYWPESIFTEMSSGSIIYWGGSVYNSHMDGKHTTSQLGSSHRPKEEYSRAAFMADVLSMPPTGEWETPPDVLNVATYPNCYNMTWPPLKPNLGYYFFYGGPGGENCA